MFYVAAHCNTPMLDAKDLVSSIILQIWVQVKLRYKNLKNYSINATVILHLPIICYSCSIRINVLIFSFGRLLISTFANLNVNWKLKKGIKL